jgi:hypothetical protein
MNKYKNVIVIYQTDNNDLYNKEFDTRAEADVWLAGDGLMYKAIIVEGDIKNIDDRT